MKTQTWLNRMLVARTKHENYTLQQRPFVALDKFLDKYANSNEYKVRQKNIRSQKMRFAHKRSCENFQSYMTRKYFKTLSIRRELKNTGSKTR